MPVLLPWLQSLKGDIVLKRRRGKVLVLNPSSGVWQITRETLRYAHQLYLRDRRDYSLLPSHLRPSTELNLGNIEPRVLTAYAGLIFRDLLDRCHGDVVLAVGAYNGGLGNPNPGYAEGVSMVAEYARLGAGSCSERSAGRRDAVSESRSLNRRPTISWAVALWNRVFYRSIHSAYCLYPATAF